MAGKIVRPSVNGDCPARPSLSRLGDTASVLTGPLDSAISAGSARRISAMAAVGTGSRLAARVSDATAGAGLVGGADRRAEVSRGAADCGEGRVIPVPVRIVARGAPEPPGAGRPEPESAVTSLTGSGAAAGAGGAAGATGCAGGATGCAGGATGSADGAAGCGCGVWDGGAAGGCAGECGCAATGGTGAAAPAVGGSGGAPGPGEAGPDGAVPREGSSVSGST